MSRHNGLLFEIENIIAGIRNIAIIQRRIEEKYGVKMYIHQHVCRRENPETGRNVNTFAEVTLSCGIDAIADIFKRKTFTKPSMIRDETRIREFLYEGVLFSQTSEPEKISVQVFRGLPGEEDVEAGIDDVQEKESRTSI